jgi:hypothetical protein
VTELSLPEAQPPAGLVELCANPVEIAEGALSAGAVARLWAGDRAALVACAGRHEGLAAFYRDRDARLAGVKP